MPLNLKIHPTHYFREFLHAHGNKEVLYITHCYNNIRQGMHIKTQHIRYILTQFGVFLFLCGYQKGLVLITRNHICPIAILHKSN